MKTFTIVLLIILVILIVACVVLYFVGKKAEKKQADQQAQLDAVAQTVSILVIDKGRMKLKEAGLPDIVIENTPKYLRRSKVPSKSQSRTKDHDTYVRRTGLSFDSG